MANQSEAGSYSPNHPGGEKAPGPEVQNRSSERINGSLAYLGGSLVRGWEVWKHPRGAFQFERQIGRELA